MDLEKGEKIRQALAQFEEVVSKRPINMKRSAVTTVTANDGLRCEVTQGKWTMIADQPKRLGGTDEGPDPGFFGRSALGICIAQGYVISFARRGLPVKSIAVRIESDSDIRGMLGLSDEVPPGFQGLRIIVEVDTEADELDVTAALDAADSLSPWLYNFKAGLEVTREVVIREPAV